MAPKTANIYFSNPRRKVEGGFDFHGNSFFNGLLPGIFPTAILLGLGIDGRPQAIAE